MNQQCERQPGMPAIELLDVPAKTSSLHKTAVLTVRPVKAVGVPLQTLSHDKGLICSALAWSHGSAYHLRQYLGTCVRQRNISRTHLARQHLRCRLGLR